MNTSQQVLKQKMPFMSPNQQRKSTEGKDYMAVMLATNAITATNGYYSIINDKKL